MRNYIFTKAEGKYFDYIGCACTNHSYDIVRNNRTGELTYLTDGIESDITNVHGTIIKHFKLNSITLTILVDGVVKEIKTMNNTIKGAINDLKCKNVKLLGARLIV